MKKQFDYQELIDEIKEDIGFDILTSTSNIQVLRHEDSDENGYHEILDWYYNNETMNLELTFEKGESKEDADEKEFIRAQYLLDKPNLEEISVEACLAEMYEKTTPASKKSSKKNNNPFF